MADTAVVAAIAANAIKRRERLLQLLLANPLITRTSLFQSDALVGSVKAL
ncbi:MAG: hypothetical protein HQK94_18905 [Nitrospirae bacterium]|nr:hypothetical protein [Nitrospirota bacterium]